MNFVVCCIGLNLVADGQYAAAGDGYVERSTVQIRFEVSADVCVALNDNGDVTVNVEFKVVFDPEAVLERQRKRIGIPVVLVAALICVRIKFKLVGKVSSVCVVRVVVEVVSTGAKQLCAKNVRKVFTFTFNS